MLFIWDEAKREANFKKHGVDFEEATSVFDDPLSITISDPLHSEEEDRFVIIGISIRTRLLVAVFTYRDEHVRIISCRNTTPVEKRTYSNG